MASDLKRGFINANISVTNRSICGSVQENDIIDGFFIIGIEHVVVEDIIVHVSYRVLNATDIGHFTRCVDDIDICIGISDKKQSVIGIVIDLFDFGVVR